MRHDFQTLAEVFAYSCTKYSSRPAYEMSGSGVAYTYSEFCDCTRRISRLLSNFGIKVSDKVALLSQSMPNWAVSFFSTVISGRIIVPMLPNLTEHEIRNILVHSESKALFVSKRLVHMVPKDLLDKMHLVITTDDLEVYNSAPESYTCDGTMASPQADDIAAIIYTSGTTGDAKGVMLSHKNFCANILASWHAHHVGKRDVFVSILPLAHTYELSIGLLYPFSVGAKVVYLSKPPTPSVLIPAFRKFRPTAMLSVPLVIEKIYRNSILPTIKGSRFLTLLQKSFPGILHTLIGIKLKKTFGGRLKFFGIGGAKLDSEVETFLHKAGFPYAIGYGVTEAAPLICQAPPFKTHIGGMGRNAFGCTIRLDNVNAETGEGEIVVKGDNVMRGYYKDYPRTQKVLSSDGWLRTGDIASIDRKGRYSIRGRLGNMILGPSGENIYPEEIEDVINNLPGINESLVVEKNGSLVALVHFDDDVLDWNYESEDKFLEELEKKKKEILDFVNTHVNSNSRIKEVEVEKQPFERTSTMKIRRFLYTQRKNDNKSTTK
ncbi:MAG: AMP-binding protein [Bacteroidales bacterium]|nr:AMP-binding protein [Bacteroidales bacterium]MDY3782847.1 AMP-binding protein [Candidatus Cryptobacteroides sp.]